MTKIVKIDRALYEVDDKTKTYKYHSRNPDWKKLSKKENQINKKYIDGYTRIFPDGRTKMFRHKEAIMATKLDLTKEYKTYYTAKTVPEIVEFGGIPFLTIEGKGEPAGEVFTKAVEALYPLAYGVKNICKKQGKDFAVPKLEGLWWVESDKPALEVPRQEWRWKLLIRMPDFVSSGIVDQAKEEVFKKKGMELIKEIKFENINEGKCIQILHTGPYSTEPETLEKMRKMMKEKKLTENGFHHEIYLSDPRKTPPQKMKTILRQPEKEII